ncbi:hypothetical protein [Arthrobacter bambusae]|uniref:Uncharacterized protein n=1 Tax=Arthrobacter bambusae TaxID=1338426 RepID=A0AAW8DFC0_9MICC|nr:hypothetical protein [Arthrobacter bambusae]MDP9904596.1 hypothetical protein [Arthrobacter bambusae]MDQ0129412.1 hypothetical protein [Arthrobacter bambusae]MDQ0180975.1 hypothetical protein [Arthrobacter bambusae]
MTTELFQALVGLLSGAIGLYGYVPYIRGTLRGRFRPNPVSWLIWALLGVVSLTGQVEGGAGFGLIVTAGTAAGCALIVLLALKATSLRAAVTTSSTLDRACLAGALLALFLLTTQHDASLAVLLSNSVGLIGFIPTVVTSIRAPWSEGVSVYAFAAGKFALAMAALPNWNLLTALYPALCLAEELAMVVLLLVARARRSVLSQPCSPLKRRLSSLTLIKPISDLRSMRPEKSAAFGVMSKNTDQRS